MVRILEIADRGPPIFVRCCAVIGCRRLWAEPAAQGFGDLFDIVCPRRPDDHLALSFVYDVEQFIETVVLECDDVAFVRGQEPAADLVQAHDLGQDGLCGGECAAFELCQRQLFHLFVGFDLFVGQRHIAADVDFVRQIETIFFQDAGAELFELLVQLVQAPVADDLLERLVAHGPLLQDGVPVLVGKV